MKKFNLVINKNWIKIFDEMDKDVYEETEKNYNKLLDSKINIFPIYKNIFNFTNYSIPDEIKVVCLGQDPYHGLFMNLKTNCFNPQAMGLAFSVPSECKIPPSLDNIYNNMLKFGHIIKKPTHGNLDFFAYQGVLLLNTSLSVEQSKPNSHQQSWLMFTDELLKIISSKYKNLIFVLWGSSAYNKLKIILNKESHKFIISSHPSPLSAYKPFKNYNSFIETDHFGLINNYINDFNELEENKINNKYIQPIVWNIY